MLRSNRICFSVVVFPLSPGPSNSSLILEAAARRIAASFARDLSIDLEMRRACLASMGTSRGDVGRPSASVKESKGEMFAVDSDFRRLSSCDLGDNKGGPDVEMREEANKKKR